ncbi:MAG: DUF4959 domain-containing protein [Tannerella sp.]|nr:DUF4959 domain-containing protein [Tannerella sp.]
MKTVYFYLSVLSTVFMCFSCTEKEMGPISESSGKPGQVEILDTITVPGGVTINYKIPPINDIIEIKAVYTLTNGQKRESSSSFYTNFMTIEGYNDTLEHEALIYTINRAREISDPVSVKFRPGESSLNKTVKSMQIAEDFGGVNFNWRNPDKTTLIFEFYTENGQGEMVTLNIFSSKTDSTNISFRGYDTIPHKFAVSIHDNFGNSSGIIYPEGGYITPLYEIKLDKKIQKILNLAGDTDWQQWGQRNESIIDDIPATHAHTGNNVVPGASITLDIGEKAKLSRILYHQIPDNRRYNYGNLRIFEIYSSDDESDNPSGDWSTWTLRMTCTVIKPSGAPVGTNTAEDLLMVDKGHEFAFPIDMPPVRYLRFRVLETWAISDRYAFIGEMTTYGIYAK